MKWAIIAGANLTLAEKQDEYETIRVRKGVHYVPHGSLLVPQANLVCELKPEPHELEVLNAGGSLFVNILGESWPPIGITVVDPALTDPAQGSA